MATSNRNYPENGLKTATLTVSFIFFFFTILLSKSVDSKQSNHSDLMQQERKMVLGSRPPQCENKCLNCRPCFATLVIPFHHKAKVSSSLSSKNDGDDRYYLLSWKCKCGQKLFQP